VLVLLVLVLLPHPILGSELLSPGEVGRRVEGQRRFLRCNGKIVITPS
jgi:hypothetical protein